MNKELALEIIKLLSALESLSFAKEPGRIPDFLIEKLDSIVEKLTAEILK